MSDEVNRQVGTSSPGSLGFDNDLISGVDLDESIELLLHDHILRVTKCWVKQRGALVILPRGTAYIISTPLFAVRVFRWPLQ